MLSVDQPLPWCEGRPPKPRRGNSSHLHRDTTLSFTACISSHTKQRGPSPRCLVLGRAVTPSAAAGSTRAGGQAGRADKGRDAAPSSHGAAASDALRTAFKEVLEREQSIHHRASSCHNNRGVTG